MVFISVFDWQKHKKCHLGLMHKYGIQPTYIAFSNINKNYNLFWSFAKKIRMIK